MGKEEMEVRPRAWQYPSFLGLDAPVVVTSWTLLISRSIQAEPPPLHLILLFFSVWAIYLSDRIIDVRNCRDWSTSSGRMAFGRRHRFLFRACLSTAASIVGVSLLAGDLTKDLWGRGLWVGLGMAGYVLAFVTPPAGLRKLPGKEIAVGLFFSLGAFCAIGPMTGIILPLAALSSLVAYNCLVISSRDREFDLAEGDTSSAAIRFPRLRSALFLLAVLPLALAALLLPPFPGIALASGASALALVALHSRARKMSGDDVRAVADFCLLTPLPLLLRDAISVSPW